MKINRSPCDCSWRACLVILIWPFFHTSASTQRQAQRPETLLQVASTEASEYLAEANLAFSDLPEPNFIDVGPPSVEFPDIPESNSIDPGPSSSEVRQGRNDAYVGPPPATRGSFLQLPPPSSFLHLQPLDPHALSGPQEQVEHGSVPSRPSPPLPSPLVPSTATELSGPATQDGQSLVDREEGQRQRIGIELLFGMQKELTKLSREVGTLAARSENSSPRGDSGLHLVGSGGGDRQTADDRKTSSDSKSAGVVAAKNWPYKPSTSATADAMGEATIWSKIGMIVPVALQILLIVTIVGCTLHQWDWKLQQLSAHHPGMLEACGWAFVVLFLADFAWVGICLSGLMDAYVKQAVVIVICVSLIIGNIIIIALVAWKVISRIGCIQAVSNVPNDLKAVKGVVTKVLNKIEAVYGQVGDGIDDLVDYFDPDYDSSTEGEKKDDPATDHCGVPIRVTIVGAQDLPDTSWFMGSSTNAYCSCAVARRRKFTFKTKTIIGNANPQWNHRHVIEDFKPGDVLKFKVWNYKDLLGKTDGSYTFGNLQPLQNQKDTHSTIFGGGGTGVFHSLQQLEDTDQGHGKGVILLDLESPTDKDKADMRRPQLKVRIERATEQHLETHAKFAGTGL